jgi:hypothetical protein
VSVYGGRATALPDVCVRVWDMVQSVVRLLADWRTYGSTHLVDPDDIGHASEFCYRWCRLDAFEQEKLLSQVLQKAVFDPEDEWGQSLRLPITCG